MRTSVGPGEKAPRRIGVVINAHTSPVEREVLRGIVRYSSEVRRWQIVGASDVGIAARVLRQWRPEASIVVGWLKGDFSPLRSVVAALWPIPGRPAVLMDEAAVGRLAAGDLQARGFRNFACVGPSDQLWAKARERGFRTALAPSLEAGATYVYRDAGALSRWDLPSPDLQHWVSHLPKPAAVFACNDHCGREVVDAALMVGLRVPEELAVLGVDNDELECEMTAAPLSSIIYPCAEVGYRAAQLLDGLLDGAPPPSEPLLVAPTSIHHRQSTNVLAVGDPAVASACRYIREHVGETIRIREVARAAGLSLRNLQIRFRRALGRTVRDDIAQSRIAMARDLLVRSRLPVKEIADRAGLGSSAHLSKVFRKRLHATPGALRRGVPPTLAGG